MNKCTRSSPKAINNKRAQSKKGPKKLKSQPRLAATNVKIVRAIVTRSVRPAASSTASPVHKSQFISIGKKKNQFCT